MIFLKTIDIVSPKITFYYNGSLAHSSIFSGILSIISVLLIIGFSTPFIYDLIRKKILMHFITLVLLMMLQH